MPQVEVYETEEADEPSYVEEFDFLPRVGEYLAREADGFFRYYTIVEVWHRQLEDCGPFRTCVRVQLDD